MQRKRTLINILTVTIIGIGIYFICIGFKKPDDIWYQSEKKIRDVLYLSDGKVMVSNAAPHFGKSDRDGNPYVLIYDFPRGKVLWEMVVEPLVPVVYDGKRLMIVDKENISAVNAENGKFIWKQSFSADMFSQIAVDEDIVVVSKDSMLYAFATENGDLQWTVEFPNRLNETLQMILWFDEARMDSGIQIFDEYVFLRTYEAGKPMCQISLDVLDKENGSLLWHHDYEQMALDGESTPCYPIYEVFTAGTLVFQPSREFIDRNWVCINTISDMNSGTVLDSLSDQNFCFPHHFVSMKKDVIIMFNHKQVLEYDFTEGKVISISDSDIEGVIAGSMDEYVVLKLSETEYQIKNLLNDDITEIHIDIPPVCGEDSELIGVDRRYLIFEAGDCLFMRNMNINNLSVVD